ncbi:MAG: tetratricopeptide repeat protein [Kofleriaceae bacterium]
MDVDLVSGTVVGGRYEVLEQIGDGVYLAKDRDLERKVTLELHAERTDAAREALAMARLAHPNVVTVFEVGEHEGRPFIATEYVAGSTLREWLAAAQREPDEILDVLLAAGEGLVAAHDAKLVHRAFTPDSVLIGSDARVRVRDFGLASESGSVDPSIDQQAFSRVARDALVHPRLRRVLAGRYPTMRELLSALRATRSRRRVVIAGAAVAAVTVGVAIASAWPRSVDTTVSCEAAGFDILTVGLDVPARVATGSYAEMAPSVEKRLAEFREWYLAIATKVCRNTYVDRKWSEELYRRASNCLDETRRVATRLLTMPTSSSGLVERVTRLRGETVCDDEMVLASLPALPRDPAALDEVIRVRVAIDTATAEYDRTRLHVLEQTIADAAASPARDDPTVAPRLDALRGYALSERGRLKEAEVLLAKAYYGARAIDDPGLALGTLSTLILSTSARLDDEATMNWMRNGIADAKRIQHLAPHSAGRLYAILASTIDGFGDPNQAMELLGKAFPLLGETPSRPLASALMTRASLYISLGKPEEAIADYRRAIELFEGLFGSEHPNTARAKISASAGLLAVGRKDAAVALAREAEAALDLHPGEATRDLAQTKLNLGVSYINSRDYAKARKYLTEAREATIEVLGEDHPDVALVDANFAYMAVAEKNFSLGVKLARETLARMEKSTPKPHEDRGQVLLVLADASRGLEDHETAIQAGEASSDEYPAGDERKILSLAVSAMVANDTGQSARALKIVEKMESLPAPTDPALQGRIAYERGRALAKTDRRAAMRSLDKAWKIFHDAEMSEWAAEVAVAQNLLRKKI